MLSIVAGKDSLSSWAPRAWTRPISREKTLDGRVIQIRWNPEAA